MGGIVNSGDGFEDFQSDILTITKANLTTKSITENGTYTPSNPYNGFSQVSVNVPTGSPIIEGTISYLYGSGTVFAQRINNILLIYYYFYSGSSRRSNGSDTDFFKISGLDLPTTRPSNAQTYTSIQASLYSGVIENFQIYYDFSSGYFKSFGRGSTSAMMNSQQYIALEEITIWS